MKNYKRILTMTICFIIIVTAMTGCRGKLISKEQSQVEATIISTYHKNSYVQVITTGKVTSAIPHNEANEVVVLYNNKKYTIDNKDAYNLCLGNDGAIVVCTFETIQYENNTSINVTSIDYLK